MKNTTQQTLKEKWTGSIDNRGEIPFGLNGLSTALYFWPVQQIFSA